MPGGGASESPLWIQMKNSLTSPGEGKSSLPSPTPTPSLTGTPLYSSQSGSGPEVMPTLRQAQCHSAQPVSCVFTSKGSAGGVGLSLPAPACLWSPSEGCPSQGTWGWGLPAPFQGEQSRHCRGTTRVMCYSTGTPESTAGRYQPQNPRPSAALRLGGVGLGTGFGFCGFQENEGIVVNSL